MSPFSNSQTYLAHTGMETDFLFNRGIDLPGFASHPLLDTKEGRHLLRDYFADQIAIARESGLGVVLESPTWMANRDRGAAIEADPTTLARRNREAIALMADVRGEDSDGSVILSGNIGPRSDAYAPTERMSEDEAQRHHGEQIGWLADTALDVVSGYTIAYPEEGIGIVRAARDRKLPVVVSWTVETDGRLPIGITLADAIEATDEATDGYALHHMVNCAHPEHFTSVLNDARDDPWMMRLRGLVANASRCSHAELDEADELDDGDPDELADQLLVLWKAHPRIAVLGGCCGTDRRHMRALGRRLSTLRV